MPDLLSTYYKAEIEYFFLYHIACFPVNCVSKYGKYFIALQFSRVGNI